MGIWVTIASLLILTPSFGKSDHEKSKKGKWEKVTVKNGFAVHRRTVEGTSLVEFRGKGVIDANLVKILAVMSDTNRMKEWVDRSLGIKILEVKSERDRIYYSATKAPWPLNDRDFVGRSRMYVNDRAGIIVLSSKNTTHRKAPKRSDRVRMPFTRVKWVFKPLSEKKTYAVFQVHADPGGVIPAWVANMVTKEMPYKTLTNLEKRANSNKVRAEFVDKYKERYWRWGWDKAYMKTLVKANKKKKKKKKRKKKKKKR